MHTIFLNKCKRQSYFE